MKFIQLLLTCLVIGAIFVAHTMNIDALYHQAQGTSGLLDDSNTQEYPLPPFHVMSDVDTTIIDTAMQQWFTSSITTQENISDSEAQKRIDQICLFYDDLCDKVLFDAPYTAEDRYTFLLYTIYLITQVDANIVQNNIGSIRTTIASVKFFMNPLGVRGQAGRRNALINTQLISSRQELFGILTHEIAGHIFDLGVLNDPYSEKSKKFKEFGKASFGINDPSLSFYELSRSTDQYAFNTNFVSGYGGSNPFEDRAEFTNARINHHAPLIKLAKQDPVIAAKYAEMSKVYGTWFLNLDISTYSSMPLQTRPFDTTRRQNTLERF